MSSPAVFRGHTLIELILVLSIAVILTSMAAPAFASVVRSVQSVTTMRALASTYQLARTAAITGRRPVIFCARRNDGACGANWTLGAIVFADTNNNRQRDADETLLASIDPLPAGSQLVMRAALAKQYLRFMPDGMLEYTAGSLVYCPPGGTARDARTLIFSRNGHLRTGHDRNRDGILENASGQPLNCPP